jgi:DNA-binding transcriptional ArsR family regulator
MASTDATTAGSFTIDRPEQLKALGHPLRLKVLQALGETDRALTNRDLAELIGVDPGHLHFHVRMLHKAGLIELAEGGRGREKPYRPVAAHLDVSPEFRSTGLSADLNAAMLDEVSRGWDAFGATAHFRAGQINLRLDIDRVRELFALLNGRAEELESDDDETITITLVAHPKAPPPQD